MGQTLSEPVVEKVRVCALLRCAVYLVLNSSPGVTSQNPGTSILCSSLFGMSPSLSHAEEIFLL
jgi:hypothetical protein